ncbi:elongation factor P maturation arginine rhamnosyltransferase EarP [Niveibacterium sp. 24ML]|uniref:elongation factor P maturation arginine rhamnosyltransferase EarP n=1 Tax=Niveibacterium sp. 24ML TaxID=2985512 RepID=UPI0022711B15|nr:elongation factor P maturation arginine rhamnosyltransferase EarP [Niveibacterium sp. 24ML]MCX9154550.1 elongation factor P maturation arginine rhamnosyltransferase EarP [Niveibacterium sp. 24ML]
MSTWRWDIFCAVVDNYGDIGVCLRLGRQLAREHGVQVRLWVDDLASYRKLAAGEARAPDGLTVHHWHADLPPDALADVVVAGFSCRLPGAYLDQMAARAPRPVWINLEYLSAESWVEGCHRLPSPHPRLPLVEHFFYPGFTARTGGLIREAGLLAAQRAFRADGPAQARCWQLLQTPEPPAGALRVSMFTYESAAMAAQLEAWAAGSVPVWCGVPLGRAWRSVSAWLGCQPAPGALIQRGQLSIAPLAFVAQDDYDRLLWSCDLNFVRGEDSFVRAQWAGRPLLWHIYPQEEAAHRVKLAAFLDRYTAGLSAEAADALRALHIGWNDGALSADAWQRFEQAMPALRAHAAQWCEALAGREDLAAALVDFAKSELK